MSKQTIPTETIIAASKAILRLEGWDVDSKVSAFHPPDALYQKYFEIAETALRAAGVSGMVARIAGAEQIIASRQVELNTARARIAELEAERGSGRCKQCGGTIDHYISCPKSKYL